MRLLAALLGYALGAGMCATGGPHLALIALLAGLGILGVAGYVQTARELPALCRRVHESAPNVVAFRAPAKRAAK